MSLFKGTELGWLIIQQITHIHAYPQVPSVQTGGKKHLPCRAVSYSMTIWEHDVCYCHEHRRQTFRKSLSNTLFVKHYALVKSQEISDATKIQQYLRKVQGFGWSNTFNGESQHRKKGRATMATVHWLEMSIPKPGKDHIDHEGEKRKWFRIWLAVGTIMDNAQQRSTTKQCIQVAQEPDSKVCNSRKSRWDEAEGSGLWQIPGSFLLCPVEALVFSEYPESGHKYWWDPYVIL